MADEILMTGMRFFDKRATAPDWVLMEFVIEPVSLFDFLNSKKEFESEFNGNFQIKGTVKRSKNGNPYAVLNTYKKQTEQPNAPATVSREKLIDPIDDLPF